MMSVRSNWPVLLLVDAEIGRQLHRAAHALGHVDEGAVGEHRRVQRRIEIVGDRDDGAEILLDDLRVLADRLRDRAEDDAGLGQLLLEGGHHRDGIEHRVDRHAGALDAGQHRALLERNAELLVGGQKLRIDLVEALRSGRLLRRGIVVDVLEIDLGIAHPRPGRLGHGQPAAEGRQPPFEHPFGLALLGRDIADGVLAEALLRLLQLDVGDEPILVLVDVDLADLIDRLANGWHSATPSTAASRAAGERFKAALPDKKVASQLSRHCRRQSCHLNLPRRDVL